MKLYRVNYIRRGNVATYNHSLDIKAGSPEMAVKKFWKHKEFPSKKTMLEDSRYEAECCNIYWSLGKVELIKDKV